MSVACDAAALELGNGVAAALRAVDCVAGETTAAAFGRLFAPGGALLTVLTILLTLYIAFFAINLLLGRASLGVRSLTPRMMTLGLVLTFVTSWIAYSSVVWNLAVGGPDQIATVITGSQGSATLVFAGKIDIVLSTLERASGNGIAPTSTVSPLGLMWLGGILLLLGTVGVLVTAKIALAVLIAVGPVFVVMALFGGTRGLFTGWLKGIVLLSLAPLFAVLAGSMMLELAVPVVASLAPNLPGQIDPQPAIAFFLLGAVHVALMIMVLKVAATMVSGWRVFGLVPERGLFEGRSAPAVAVPAALPAAATAAPAAALAAVAADRRIPVSSFAVAPAANDAGASAQAASRDTRVITREVASGSTKLAAASGEAPSRASGIGSRFRAPPPRLSEKVK